MARLPGVWTLRKASICARSVNGGGIRNTANGEGCLLRAWSVGSKTKTGGEALFGCSTGFKQFLAGAYAKFSLAPTGTGLFRSWRAAAEARHCLQLFFLVDDDTW